MLEVKCAVADSQGLDRKGLIALLGAQMDIRVVGEARTLLELERVCRRSRPDLVILDSRFPGANGSPMIQGVRDRCGNVALLVLVRDAQQRCMTAPASDSADEKLCCEPPDCCGQAIFRGADGVLRRNAPPGALFRSIRSLGRGRASVSPVIVRSMMKCIARQRRVEPARALTSRERQVANLIGEGLCNKEISDRLQIEVATVKKHIGHILLKLDLQDRLQVGLLVARTQPFLERSPSDPTFAVGPPEGRPGESAAADRVLPQ
ncbi:response regulator transcription factor [bacterium]|nr:response regulator transcription factor [bacterium]